jgi:CMP-N,N'-diacetyllegionaminic acid synthase
MICIIPAKKYSRSLKNKNLLKIKNKSLIEHTIEHAIRSKKISQIIVNSDNKKVNAIVQKYNNKLKPISFYLRNKKLSKFNSAARDVYLDCIENITKKKKIKINHFCVMLPTTPIRKVNDIDKAINYFYKKKAKVLLSIVENKPIEYLFRINKNFKILKIKSILNSVKNRQFLKKTYYANGSIFIFDCNYLKKNKSYISNKTYAYLMSKKYSIDIDTVEDFQIAKKIM